MQFLWHILLAIIWIVGGLVACIVGSIVIFFATMVIGTALTELRIRLNPRCSACRRRKLKRYALDFSDATLFRYYGCQNCRAQFKRGRRGEWVSLGQGVTNEAEYNALFVKQAYALYRARETEVADPLGSWLGKIHVGLPGENWPEHVGVPMLPLCQLRCSDAPFLPPALQNVALLCVFVASRGEETVSPNGEKWLIRAYDTLEGLVPLAYPGDTTHFDASPLVLQAHEVKPYNRADLPEALWIDFEERRHFEPSIQVDGHALPYAWNFQGWVGGYSYMIDCTVKELERLQADLVFQISMDGVFPWKQGADGTVAFARSHDETGKAWFAFWPSSKTIVNASIQSVVLGCELDGIRLFLQSYGRDCQLKASSEEHTGSVYHLCDLQGLVRITSEEQALQFARLSTSGFLRYERVAEYEILTPAEHAARPTGYKYWTPEPVLDDDVPLQTVLEANTFQQSGFEPAQVVPIESGFLITRWTYTPGKYYYYFQQYSRRHKDGTPLSIGEASRLVTAFEGHPLSDAALKHGTVQKIEETVAPDGAYARRTLERRDAPQRDKRDSQLLRPASQNGSEDGSLLRPSTGGPETPPDELLRPAD